MDRRPQAVLLNMNQCADLFVPPLHLKNITLKTETAWLIEKFTSVAPGLYQFGFASGRSSFSSSILLQSYHTCTRYIFVSAVYAI